MIPINSKTLRYGLGCFETIKLFPPNKPAFLQAHLERLLDGLKILGLNTVTDEELRKKLDEYLKLNNFNTTQVLRIIATEEAGISVFAEPYEDKKNNLSLSTSSKWFVDSHSPLNSFKSFNYLKNYLAKQDALAAGFDDALLLNERSEIVETTSANLFFKTLDKKWITSSISSGPLPGVIRQLLIPFLKADEVVILQKDLKQFTAVIAVNSLVEVQAVIKIDHSEYNPPSELDEIKVYLRQAALNDDA